MLKNYIIIAIRSFKRNKFYSSLNVMGLSVGIATAILSFLYVANELSYDRFHANTDRIYRIAVDALSGTTVIKQTATPAAMPAALYNEFSEIEAVCRINGGNSSTKVEYNGNTFIEPDVFLTDTTFFKIFTGEFLAGETGPGNLSPNRAVITEKLAGKYFGNRNPIGQLLVLDDEYHIEVAAVVREFPANSHFHFDMLVSLLSFEGLYNNPNWFANNFRTYIMLQKNQNYKNLEAKLPAFVDKYLFDGKYKERAIDGNKWELYLQPLT
ncbi:MAG: ABC transporter permease, partial [Calditrichia bacterium]|nr:ABC transporter permease [Calditrichia bacterium]